MKTPSKKNVKASSVQKATRIKAAPEAGGVFKKFLNKIKGK